MSLASGQGWDEVDTTVREWVSAVPDELEGVLSQPVTGAYLHGSLAMGDYHRATSDLDLLVVVPHPLSAGERREVAHAFARHNHRRPTPGSLEVSVLTTTQAAAQQYPIGFEVHYSADWHAQVLTDQIDWATQRSDEDLPAHVHVARTRGVPVAGPGADKVIGKVPGRRFVAAVLDDLDWLSERVDQNPTYAVLNSCRVLELAAQDDPLNDPQVLSKGEAARWATVAFPRFSDLIHRAHASRDQEANDVSAWGDTVAPGSVLAMVTYAQRASAALRVFQDAD